MEMGSVRGSWAEVVRKYSCTALRQRRGAYLGMRNAKTSQRQLHAIDARDIRDACLRNKAPSFALPPRPVYIFLYFRNARPIFPGTLAYNRIARIDVIERVFVLRICKGVSFFTFRTIKVVEMVTCAMANL